MVLFLIPRSYKVVLAQEGPNSSKEIIIIIEAVVVHISTQQHLQEYLLLLFSCYKYGGSGPSGQWWGGLEALSGNWSVYLEPFPSSRGL